jgi:hypothetical protein
MSAQPSGGHGRFISGSQIPEKSGLPSGVRGVDARRFGEPSGNLGTPAVGYVNHCAEADAALITANTTVTLASRTTHFIMSGLAVPESYIGSRVLRPFG